MKNFTKQNFKTNPLWIRLLIMAFMLLIGSSSAWGGVLFTNDYIFLDLSGSQGEWEKDGAVFQVALNEWDHCGSGWSESKLSKKYDLIETSEGSHIYYANVSDDNKSRYGAYFYRCNPSDKSVWNTACIGYSNSTHNCFKVNGWTSSTSTYKLTGIYCISAPTFGEVEVGQSATSSGTYLYAGVSTIPEISNNPTEFQYVAGSSSITTNGLSTITVKFTPSSAGDKTGTLKFGSYLTTSLSGKGKVSCTPSATLSSANYDAVNNEIDLSGSIAPCGKTLFYGFLWKDKNSDWVTDNAHAISGTGGNDNKTAEDKDFAQSWKDFTPGDTYQFTAYALDATTNPYTWYYSTNENDVIEVSTCTSIPNNTYAIVGNNEWTGNANPVTINYDANTYGTPTILYDGEEQIPTKVGTYAITINVPAYNGYCASTISLGNYEITCINVEKPNITTTATVCAGTQVTLSNYNGVNDNTVKWYSDEECNSEVTEQVTLTDNDTKYYAKAYHAASGCYSSQYSTLTFTVNALPTISIGDNTNAVKFEDVKLTATGNNIDDVTWIADKGTITKDANDPKKAVLTYDQTGTVTVTATATSAAGCTSVAATKTVTFGEENCKPENSTKIEICVTGTNGATDVRCYAWYWDGSKNVELFGTWPGNNKYTTETYNGKTYRKWSYDMGNLSNEVWIKFSNNGGYQTTDIDNDMYKNNKYYYTYDKGNSSYSKGGSVTLATTAITAPAVKTVSVTSDEDGNVTMVGQVVKTGCDTQAILGLQYKKQNPDGTTYEAIYTTYPNPGTKEAISAGKTFTVTTKLEDGTYLVRARIDNSHATNGYGEDIKVVVNTKKTPISNVTLNYCDKNGGNVGVDPNPMCKGATAYVKLSYRGSKYSDIKWLVEGVETNLVTDEGDGVWSYEIQGNGSLSVELKNDANTDPAWPYSNKLPFSIIPVPTAPYISIDPASGVICEGSTATIKVENRSTACSYKLVEEEEDPEAEFVEYESGDLKYSVGSVGKYYVAAKHKLCPTNEYTSNQVAINQIIRTNANISIEPEETETTPWEPVSITVTADEGYIYEVTYTSNNLANVDGVIIKQNGDTYTYRIPRPIGWGEGHAVSERTPVSYGIKAQLKVDGEANQCDLSFDTATITVKDEENEDCD